MIFLISLSFGFTLFYWQPAIVLFSHTKLVPANQQYFSLTPNQYQPPTSQQYFSLAVNQHLSLSAEHFRVILNPCQTPFSDMSAKQLYIPFTFRLEKIRRSLLLARVFVALCPYWCKCKDFRTEQLVISLSNKHTRYWPVVYIYQLL